MVGPVALYGLYYTMYGEDTNSQWAKEEARVRIARAAKGEEVKPGVYYAQRERAEALAEIHREVGVKCDQ